MLITGNVHNEVQNDLPPNCSVFRTRGIWLSQDLRSSSLALENWIAECNPRSEVALWIQQGQVCLKRDVSACTAARLNENPPPNQIPLAQAPDLRLSDGHIFDRNTHVSSSDVRVHQTMPAQLTKQTHTLCIQQRTDCWERAE